MELSSEDALRINVLLASPIEAVRIDESSMTVYALLEKGEARVKLNPNCRDETYLRSVREVLSSHVLGSPGGYPVYLKRWTRMGQARDEILESLLLLGEPEAVVAVVNASGVTNEIARRAWWALQTAENARCMLRQSSVVQGDMGSVLADFLVEFLPFEEEARDMIETVRLVLQPGLISEKIKQIIWARGKHKNSYLVGFLQAIPDELPEQLPPHPQWQEMQGRLAGLQESRNTIAVELLRILSAEGQTMLGTVSTILGKPSNQDVVVELLQAISGYFRELGLEQKPDDMENALEHADAMLSGDPAENPCIDDLGEVLAVAPDLIDHVRALLVLAMSGESLVNPIFARTDAIGTVMRKKLMPVTGPLQQQIDILLNQ